MMVIQLPEWNGWRIEGKEMDWQVRKLTEKGEWRPTNFFPSLDAALSFAYERALRESEGDFSDLKDVAAECAKLKASLLKAVRKEVG